MGRRKKKKLFSEIEPANGVIASHGMIYCGSRVEESRHNPESMSPEAAFSQWHLWMRRFTALYRVFATNQHDKWLMKVDRGQRSLIGKHHARAMPAKCREC